MTQFVFANEVSTTLASAVSSTATQITLSNSANLPELGPGQILPMCLSSATGTGAFEVVYATEISGGTLTVLRGQEGTSATSFNAGDYAYCAPTADTVAPVISYHRPKTSETLPAANQLMVLPPDNIDTDITLTLNQNAAIGSVVTVYGTAANYTVTITSPVSSGSPALEIPGDSNSYSYTIPEASPAEGLRCVWDGTNWKCQPIAPAQESVNAPAGTYSLAQITINSNGQVTDATSGTAEEITSTLGYTPANPNNAAGYTWAGPQNLSAGVTLPNTGVNTGTYGSSTTVPVVTVDSDGRLSSISTATISSGGGGGGSSTSPINFITAYGGSNDGTTDNTDAWNKMVSAARNGAITVYFPSGTYYFASSVANTVSNANARFTIFGDGADNTVFSFASGDGLTVTLGNYSNSFSARGITFAAGGANVGAGVTLNITTPSSTPAYSAITQFENCAFRGSDGWYETNYWEQGILNNGVSNVAVINCNFAGAGASGYASDGIGISTTGSSSSTPPVVLNVIGCNFGMLGIVIQYGEYQQGVFVTDTNMTGCGTGVYVPQSISGLDELTVTGCQMNCINVISIGSLVNAVGIINNYFITPNSSDPYAIQLQEGWQFQITGNTFGSEDSSTCIGVYIDGSSNMAGVIQGNSFSEYATAIELGSTSANVKVLGNVYDRCGTEVSNSGSNNVVGSQIFQTSPVIINSDSGGGTADTTYSATGSIDCPCAGSVVVMASFNNGLAEAMGDVTLTIDINGDQEAQDSPSSASSWTIHGFQSVGAGTTSISVNYAVGSADLENPIYIRAIAFFIPGPSL